MLPERTGADAGAGREPAGATGAPPPHPGGEMHVAGGGERTDGVLRGAASAGPELPIGTAASRRSVAAAECPGQLKPTPSGMTTTSRPR